MEIYQFPIVNIKKLLNLQKKPQAALGHFNVMNLMTIKAILEVVVESKKPVIVAVSDAKADYLGGLATIAGMVKNLISFYNITTPIALHLDHSHSYDRCLKAIELGYSSVMFDGSRLPFSENLAILKKLTTFAHKYNVTVEGEIGSIGGGADHVVGFGEIGDDKEAKIISTTTLDLLAAGVGNVHGKYPPEWKSLDFEAIKRISRLSQKPLVLHGSSWIPDWQITKAIQLGVRKINVNSELICHFAWTLKEDLAGKVDNKIDWEDPRFLFKNGYQKMKNVISEKIKLFSLEA